MKPTITPHSNKRIRFGFRCDDAGRICVNEKHADVIRLIYQLYLSGHSIRRIIDSLAEQEIPSPQGKSKWSYAAVDNLLDDCSLVPDIIEKNTFHSVQLEKERRSPQKTMINEKAKPTRYHSTNELSGLFICGECGSAYRRITLKSGEVVWRCANRVEHGKRICHNSPTTTEKAVLEIVQQVIQNTDSTIHRHRQLIDSITVGSDSSFTFRLQQESVE